MGLLKVIEGLISHISVVLQNDFSPFFTCHSLSLHECNLLNFRNLQANMEGPYGSEWPTEEKVKRKEMVMPEARYIFVHEAPNASSDEILTMSERKETLTVCLENRGSMVGFVQYRFTLEEEIPVLYVYELQLEPHVQAKGLGKFLMQLIELIARKVLSHVFSSHRDVINTQSTHILTALSAFYCLVYCH